ncbi:MAG: NTP transferase domain-containing protein [Pseudomonadales bacterium]|nr:NTP transferase domain-containing protein [Pseudomonadales bacterium]
MPDSLSTPSAAVSSALIMAARRPGKIDPLAAAAGVSHKCMIPINGRVMLERVVQVLVDTGCFRHIYISIDDASVLNTNEALKNWIQQGLVSTCPAEGNLADSILAASKLILPEHWPLMLTTGDNALHNTAIILDFVAGMAKENCDLTLGITHEDDVKPTIPNPGLAYHRLKDGGFSSCNLYGLSSPKALKVVEVFRSGGQFGKKPWRILKSFGIMTFILYKLRAITGDAMTRRIGKKFRLKAAAVNLPYDFGPIDVDNPFSFRLSEDILIKRESSTS